MHDCGVKLVSGRDGGYILPLEIDPPRFSICIEIPDDIYHIAAFWGALDTLTWSKNWQRDEAHTAAQVSRVWTRIIDAANDRMNAGERCQDETNCNIIPLQSERITWYPESPYAPGEEVPPGYIFHPWTVVTPGTLSGVIGEFGLGYRSGDVYTDLTKLPPGDWSEILEGNYLGLPYLRVNDLNGEGTVKVEFLNIPQGGRALLAVDGVVNIFTWQIAELNKDAIPPGETQTPFTVEVEVHGLGVHYVDVVILPTVDVSPIPVFFGGGFRSIQICGFGETAMTDPCCPEELDILREMLALWKGGMKLVPLTSELPSDFTVDCTPQEFDGNEGDTVPVQIMRHNAMCLALTRWMVSVIGNRAEKMNQRAKLPEVWALGGFTSAPEMYGGIQYVEFDFTVAFLNTILEDDDAFNQVICMLMLKLSTESNTFAVFKKKIQELYDEVSVEENVAHTLLALIAKNYSTSRANYTLFAQELEKAFEDLDGGYPFDCSCVSGACDVDDFILVLDTPGTATKIDADTWEFTVPVTEITEADVQVFRPEIRDASWRCFNHIGSSVSQSYYRIYNCAGSFLEGVGGGGGELVWHQMTISFPSGSHVTSPLTFQITIQCPA